MICCQTKLNSVYPAPSPTVALHMAPAAPAHPPRLSRISARDNNPAAPDFSPAPYPAPTQSSIHRYPPSLNTHSRSRSKSGAYFTSTTSFPGNASSSFTIAARPMSPCCHSFSGCTCVTANPDTQHHRCHIHHANRPHKGQSHWTLAPAETIADAACTASEINRAKPPPEQNNAAETTPQPPSQPQRFRAIIHGTRKRRSRAAHGSANQHERQGWNQINPARNNKVLHRRAA